MHGRKDVKKDVMIQIVYVCFHTSFRVLHSHIYIYVLYVLLHILSTYSRVSIMLLFFDSFDIGD